jgi:hypothetical protein
MVEGYDIAINAIDFTAGIPSLFSTKPAANGTFPSFTPATPAGRDPVAVIVPDEQPLSILSKEPGFIRNLKRSACNRRNRRSGAK